jgi:AraC-like DNA-binding protein
VLQIQSFSTDGVPAGRRIDYWNEITTSALAAQIADPVDRHRFCGRMTYLDLDGVRFLELNASGSTVTRTRSHVACEAQPAYLVRLAISGEVTAVQDEHDVHLRTGDFTLSDTTRPYKIFFREPSAILIFRIPRDRLLQYIGRPEAMIGIRMAGDSGLSGLASRHLRELWSASREFITHGVSARMMEMTMQLLASAYSVVPDAKADRFWLRSAHRSRIVELIERRLSDPELTPTSIALELRMKPWYMHRVFSGGTETVSRYILRRRLDKCAAALGDPHQASRSITEIAFGQGFNSLPHFCRVFRERFGGTPNEYRKG